MERYSPSTSPQIPSSVITVPAHHHISLRDFSLKRTGVPALARPENGVYVISSTAREKPSECGEKENAARRGEKCTLSREEVAGGAVTWERERGNFGSFYYFARWRTTAPTEKWSQSASSKLSLRHVCVEVALTCSLVRRARLTFRGRHAGLIKLHRRKRTRAKEKLDPASSSPSSFVESFLLRVR